MYADAVDPAEVGRQWLERMGWTTRRALAARDRRPDAGARFIDVWYRDAVADPIGCVERDLRRARPRARARRARRMERWLAADAGAKSAGAPIHPEQFGLSERAIRDAFAEYMARFIDPRDAGLTAARSLEEACNRIRSPPPSSTRTSARRSS